MEKHLRGMADTCFAIASFLGGQMLFSVRVEPSVEAVIGMTVIGLVLSLLIGDADDIRKGGE